MSSNNHEVFDIIAIALNKAADEVKARKPTAVPSASQARIESLIWEKERLTKELEEAQRDNRRLVARIEELSAVIDERSANVRELEQEMIKMFARAERDRLAWAEHNERLRNQLASKDARYFAENDKLRAALNTYLRGCVCCRKPEGFVQYDAFGVGYSI